MATSTPTSTIDINPLEPAVCFLGSVEIRCISGKVRVLGVELSSSDSEWHMVHSPAGGLTACLQTASAISSGARVSMRRVAPPALPSKKRKAKHNGQGGAKNKSSAGSQGNDSEEEDADGDDHDDDDADQAMPDFAVAQGRENVEGLGELEARLGIRLFRAPASLSTRLGAAGVPVQWEQTLDWLAPQIATGTSTAAGTPSAPAAPAGGKQKKKKKGAAAKADAEAASSSDAAGPPPVVLLCGARNVGKSSFGRLLLNRVLAEGAASARFLEADVGQCEFTPPSLVAIHDVTAPCLGPPHTHLRPPRHCRFFGDASPAAAPRQYIECLTSLLAEHRRSRPPSALTPDAPAADQPSMPLIINTCGWMSGLGGQLLAELIAHARPTHVVFLELASPGAAPNADPPLAPLEAAGAVGAHVIRLPALSSANGGANGGGGGGGGTDGAYDDVDDEDEDGGGGGGAGDGASGPQSAGRGDALPRLPAPVAQESRALQLLAYLGALPECVRRLPGAPAAYAEPHWRALLTRLLSAPPLAVPMASLRAIVLKPSDDGDAAAASRPSDRVTAFCLNGSFVGLLRPTAHGSGDGSGGGGAGSWASHECVGMALVRSVDAESGLLFLSTPVPAESLVGVDVLARSSLEVPLALLQPTAITPASPFLSADTLRSGTPGGQRMRSRNNLVRGPNKAARG
jgi:polynucleotide 5'-hydroxyl-kinase GRC3/NOL9